MRIALSLLVVFPAMAGEYAVLQNGFRIHASHHEVIGDSVRLHTATGNMDVPAGSVVRFEVEEYVKPPEPQNAAAPVAPSPEIIDPKELIDNAAEKHGLLPEFVRSVAAAESAYRQSAMSPKGAIGLMQLMPATARELGVDPHDAAENADGGTRYLKELLIKYKDSHDPVRLALAAYNAGPGAVARYKTVPPYRETQQYIERVLRKYLAELRQKKIS